MVEAGVEVLVQPEVHELTHHMHEIRNYCAMAFSLWRFIAIYTAVLYQPNKPCVRAVKKDCRPTKTVEQALDSANLISF
jgi:hypothetical protein